MRKQLRSDLLRADLLTGNAGRGRLLAVAAAVMFGTAYIGTAFAIHSFTPTGAAMWRGILASAALLPLVVSRAAGAEPGEPPPWTRARLWRLLVLGLTGGLLFVVAMHGAVAMAGATLAGFAASLSPVIAALLAPVVLGEALTLASIAGFAVAVVGTALLSAADTGDVGPGVVAGVLAALAFALFLVLSRRWSRSYRLDGSTIALAIAATTGLGLLAVELVLEPGQLIPGEIKPEAALGLLWLALVPGVLAQLAVVASVRRVETQTSAAMLLISPLTTALLGAVLLGETLGELQLLGAVLIAAGVVGAGVAGERSSRVTQRRSPGLHS